MTWRRQSRSATPQLAEERKLLAERYTIDADEAERREELAVEEAAREAEEEARRTARRRPAAAEEATRRAAEEELERKAVDVEATEAEPEQPVAPALAPQPDPAETAPSEEEPAADGELPIYRWFGGR